MNKLDNMVKRKEKVERKKDEPKEKEFLPFTSSAATSADLR
jgi:hypothetical protein